MVKNGDFCLNLNFWIEKYYFNTEEFVNQQFAVNMIETPPDESKRTGVVAKKMGMTGVWDKWGRRIALTVLQVINRVLIVLGVNERLIDVKLFKLKQQKKMVFGLCK